LICGGWVGIGVAILKFRLVTTEWCSASEILVDYPQLTNKIEVTDGNAYVTIERAEEFMELVKLAGEVVVGEVFLDTGEPYIEIYDSYRE
jgi:hypothetical protein